MNDVDAIEDGGPVSTYARCRGDDLSDRGYHRILPRSASQSVGNSTCRGTISFV